MQPDVLFVSNARAGILADRKNVKGAPDLVVEILSKSTRKLDQETKLVLYDHANVWSTGSSIPTGDPVPGASAKPRPGCRSLRGGRGVLTSPLLPGFSLPLADVFEP